MPYTAVSVDVAQSRPVATVGNRAAVACSPIPTKAASVMFTIEQINDLHARRGSARTLPEYVRALNALGVERYDSYLADGHSEYFGQGGHRVVSPPVHEVLSRR